MKSFWVSLTICGSKLFSVDAITYVAIFMSAFNKLIGLQFDI